ncbi:hypothetical protein B9Z19DRAFT_1095220 [Tuber borchii]|uniref:Secreted protein n=1 Tax=Tuber borchii TaxID=42251 RepID=A0A2T6ZD11_TUBBO|nr:hypothetical protein B9Z19DRAFT_1095220 [Tuber borchii]
MHLLPILLNLVALSLSFGPGNRPPLQPCAKRSGTPATSSTVRQKGYTSTITGMPARVPELLAYRCGALRAQQNSNNILLNKSGRC